MAKKASVDPLRLIGQEHLWRLCQQFPLGYEPELVWKAYRVTAGLAYYRKGVIGLSTRVLKDEAAVIATLTHEYAHLLAVARHGNAAAGHGPAWKQAMLDLGQEPKVRHNYEVEHNVSRQVVTYQCTKCGREFVRTRRFPKQQRYIHAKCGGNLKLKKVERITGETKNA